MDPKALLQKLASKFSETVFAIQNFWQNKTNKMLSRCHKTINFEIKIDGKIDLDERKIAIF